MILPTPHAGRLYFRGLEVPTPEGNQTLFEQYYAVVEKDVYTGLTFSIAYKNDGYNPFTIVYKNGRPAGRGSCMVKTHVMGQILYDISDVKEAEYYAPDGTLAATVHDGTGTQIFYYSDGSKYWELELENYQRKSLKTRLKDGTLKIDETY